MRLLSRFVLCVCLLSGCRAAPPAVTPTLPAVATQTSVPTATFTPTLTPLPSFTPTASHTPVYTAAPTACVDDLTIILRYDLAQADPARLPIVPAGAPEQAGWRVRNSGSCIWDRAYSLAAADGGQPQPLPRQVAPGEMVDLFVSLRVPPAPGGFSLTWEVRNGQGRPVGQPLAVQLVSAGLPVPTLAAGVTIAAYPASIQPGDSSVISWQVSDAREVYFYPLGQPWQRYPVAPTADRVEAPARSTTYELRVVRGDNSVETYRVAVLVEPFNPPHIIYFNAEPEPERVGGWCVLFTWDTENRVNGVSLWRGDVLLQDDLPDRGSWRYCPSVFGRTLFHLQVIGPGGVTWKERWVDLGAP